MSQSASTGIQRVQSIYLVQSWDLLSICIIIRLLNHLIRVNWLQKRRGLFAIRFREAMIDLRLIITQRGLCLEDLLIVSCRHYQNILLLWLQLWLWLIVLRTL